ncbi:MAG: phage integrase SAM-like domain-containing protein, partial [Bacteroidota bacterium]
MKKMTIGFHPMEHKKNPITKMTPLYIRLLSNGRKTEARLPKEYDLSDYDLKKWNKFQQRIDAKESDINDFLNSITIRKKKLDLDSLLINSSFSEKEYIDKLLNRIESSNEDKEPTLYEYAKKYLRQEIENSNKKEGTKKNYRNAINQLCQYLEFCGYKELLISQFKFTHANGFKKFLESDLKSLEKQKIVNNYHQPISFLGKKEKNSVVSSSTKIKNVKPIFRHALNEELIKRNPFEG